MDILLCITISYLILLLIGNPHAVAAALGIAIKPKPVRGNVVYLDVVAMITNVSNDLIIVFNVSYFSFLFFD